MKEAAAFALLLLAACAEGTPPAAGGPDTGIECRIAGAARFERACTLETSESREGLVLTIRKPDGGFRRLLAANDDRGVIAADGAEQARIALLGDGRIEVAIGGDRFRLPAPAGR
jgi:hypothetical protein